MTESVETHTSDERAAWYAVRVRGRQENIVAAALTQKGHEVFLPQYRCRRQWSDRVKEATLPLFPGYLFSRFDIAARLPLMTTLGVLQIVAAGETFLPVEPEEIAALQQVVACGAQVQPWPYLRVGQRVRIEGGPLRGVEGVLARVDDRRHLVVSVTLLQRSVAVRIDPSHVFPANTREHVLGLQAWQPGLSALGE